MLDPKYLQKVTEELESYWYNLETKILCEIAERIKSNENNLSSTADYLLAQAHAMNVSNDKINRYLSDALDISSDEVKKIIENSSYISISNDNKIFDKAVELGVIDTYAYNPDSFKNIIEQGVALTTAEIDNICRTTAVTARQKLTKALNTAYMEVSTGTFSSDKAVENAIKQLANENLSLIDYATGTHRRLDTVVRTAVRTGVNTTAAKCQEKNLDDLGCNLVETTSHLGARPSHAEWQGEVFYRKTPHKDYRNFYDATGYGTAGGLCGVNCRHSFYPFIEGISNPVFEKFDSEENNRLYELEQQQRYNERKIRSWKRKKEIKETCGYDTTKENEKIRYWKYRNNKLVASDDRLRHNYSRERVYTSKINNISFKDDGMLDFMNSFKNNELPKQFEFSEEIQKNINHNFKELRKRSNESGTETLCFANINDGKIIGGYSEAFKRNEVKPTQKQIDVLNNARVDSLFSQHTHPTQSPFSFRDLVTHNQLLCVKISAVETVDGYQYFISTPDSSRIVFENEKDENLFIQACNIKLAINKNKYKDKSLSEVRHITLKEISNSLGWNYGRKKR